MRPPGSPGTAPCLHCQMTSSTNCWQQGACWRVACWCTACRAGTGSTTESTGEQQADCDSVTAALSVQLVTTWGFATLMAASRFFQSLCTHAR